MEAYILNIYFTFYIFQRIRSFCNFRLFLQQIKDPACACKRVLKLCNNRTDIIKWFHILIGIGEKYGKSSDCQLASGNMFSSARAASVCRYQSSWSCRTQSYLPCPSGA